MTRRAKSEIFKRLSNLPQQQPKTKAGQVRWLWPEIKTALDTGHTLKEIWEALVEDGIQVQYAKFRFYVARLRQAETEAASQLQHTAAKEPRSRAEYNDGSASPQLLDPLANVKEREAHRPRFEYQPGLEEEKLF